MFRFDEDEKAFPAFIPDDIGQMLNRARKSLVLLRAAQPDHSLLSGRSISPDIRWFWTSKEVEDAFLSKHTMLEPRHYLRTSTESSLTGNPGYKDEMQIFELFELEPSSLLNTWSITLSAQGGPASRDSAYKYFVESFPSTLPSLTPTMPDLTRIVLLPLMRHVGALSGALVDLLLSRTTYLHFPLHLQLLRSFLLLTSYAFKNALQSALFSDTCGTEDLVGSYAAHITHSRARSRTASASGTTGSSQWTIGISQELSPDGSWPPAGASLSFVLRTVIIDSINMEYRPQEEYSSAASA